MTYQLNQQIAAQLGETQYVPFAQIGRIIERVGPEVAQAFADEAVALAAAGSMLTPDGIPRTVGGIFFFLVRQRVDPALTKEIFLRPATLRSMQQEPASPQSRRTPATEAAAPSRFYDESRVRAADISVDR